MPQKFRRSRLDFGSISGAEWSWLWCFSPKIIWQTVYPRLWLCFSWISRWSFCRWRSFFYFLFFSCVCSAMVTVAVNVKYPVTLMLTPSKSFVTVARDTSHITSCEPEGFSRERPATVWLIIQVYTGLYIYLYANVHFILHFVDKNQLLYFRVASRFVRLDVSNVWSSYLICCNTLHKNLHWTEQHSLSCLAPPLGASCGKQRTVESMAVCREPCFAIWTEGRKE